jgi:transcriptional regulator with GAF, ATPase, and Fis domain
LFLARIARGERPAYTRARDEFERLYIASVLADHDGNVTHAAAALRLTRQSLQRMIQRLGVRRIVRG